MGRRLRTIFLTFITAFYLLCLIQTTFANEKEFVTDVSLGNAIDLSGEWKFHKIVTVDESMVRPDYDDSNWSTVQAPATWDDQGIQWERWDIPLVLYRRTVLVPAEWEGKTIGINCWFSRQSNVYVNGIVVKPSGPLYARYGNVTNLIRYGKNNYLAVTALKEGKIVLTEGGPPRVGILEKRPVTKVIQEDITITADGKRIDAIIFHPAGIFTMPGLILVATAHHGWGVVEPWLDFADELAREGYSSLIIASQTPRLEHVLSAVEYLASLEYIDTGRLGVIGADMAAKFAILAAAEDRRIKTVISMSSPVVTLDEKTGLCPILLIASEYDTNAELAARRMGKYLGGPSEVLLFKGKVHGITFLEEKWTIIRQKILGWLKMYL